MPTSESLLVRREGRVLRLTLNRPGKRNALSEELCGALADALDDGDADPRVGAILLEAAGPIFCAGMDLDEVLSPDAAARTAIHERIFTAGFRLTTPIVACVQGPAFGGGVGLIANAHIAVAAQGASFGLTEIRLGLWPYVIFRAMTHAIGERRTVALSLTSRIFSVPEALQWGLLAESASPIEVDDRATAIAQQLADSSGDTVRRGLRYVRDARDLDAAAAGTIARDYRAENFRSLDFTEGVNAFHEKRKPKWPSNEA
jgi:enoyl-CoA hydratase/carnithine racemase